MQAILSYFWQLCLLRQGPERIPPSLTLTTAAGLFYVAVECTSLILNRPDLGFGIVLGMMMLGLLIECSAFYLLLLFKGLRARFFSGMSAIFGCNTIVLLILVPINYLLRTLDEGLTSDIVGALSLVCLFWWLSIVGFILHRTANIGLVQGIALAFVIELLVAVVLRGTFAELRT